MSKDRITLSSIVLTTAEGQEVKLSVAEARALHAQLEELFGEKVRYMPSQPIIIGRDRWPAPWRPYRPFWWGDDQPRCIGNDITPRTSWGVTTQDSASGLRVRYEGARS